ncbi:glycosyltransferase family 59 protein [Thermothielavioides terrestris NRRL 8126]|uniref:Dol-P-Glc:Glc(2)Man(9)GlcNAc(2)-PP-Dol alpha-1,2-glucosyltransferase n=1 Tax=Thermothielavioides terrestris (strain ATCC 38088 / NRRL 8126) TaxID=578455 RepID=G2RD16_THETT|nr:glycosyltransferase family 59 protein [Thermothielavioides terrestris NRRL 8126]AEO70709.1 glycosyltransferase family 59 protein [Thermothielavioides terrestris NRRL 8126]
MDALQAVRHGLTLGELLKGLGIAFALGRLLSPGSESGLNKAGLLSPLHRADVVKTAGFFSLFLAARSWLAFVDRYAPEPYLDEVFHIPQAQAYCEGRFWDWDDKITTPPGLYLLSVAYHKLWVLPQCTPSSLRYNNLLATLLTAVLAAQCRHLLEVRAAEREDKQVPRNCSFYSYHTGLNIALFPVLFFFSALYYTDVVSALTVLVAYRNHLLRLAPQPPGLVSDVWTVLLGVAALLMRQTNVFWVVVYMGGLEAAHVLRSVKPPAWLQLAKLHDPPTNESGPEDWVLCALSIGVSALCNPVRVLRQIWPHMAVLAMFAGFVAWNGGVVLGDKSNHVATIHLAQMLYIWPFFAFFSAPLFLPSLTAAITSPLRYLGSVLAINSPRSALISISYTVLTILLSLAVVKYNTIIHPFTLADNRHYMFYAFRYTILRSPTLRIALVPIYTFCRWLAWDTLSGTRHNTSHLTSTSTDTNNKPRIGQPSATKPSQQPSASHHPRDDLALLADDTSGTISTLGPPTSTTLLLLLATALSLVTAPLVEPRYFILPWVFYRLLVPAWCPPEIAGSGGCSNTSSSTTTTTTTGTKTKSKSETKTDTNQASSWQGRWQALHAAARKVDARLVLETAWFAAVNGATMAVFLFRPFYWCGEGGEVLDGGRVQRFMW